MTRTRRQTNRPTRTIVDAEFGLDRSTPDDDSLTRFSPLQTAFILLHYFSLSYTCFDSSPDMADGVQQSRFCRFSVHTCSVDVPTCVYIYVVLYRDWTRKEKQPFTSRGNIVGSRAPVYSTATEEEKYSIIHNNLVFTWFQLNIGHNISHVAPWATSNYNVEVFKHYSIFGGECRVGTYVRLQNVWPSVVK